MLSESVARVGTSEKNILYDSDDLGVDAQPLPSAQSDHLVSGGIDSTYAVLEHARAERHCEGPCRPARPRTPRKQDRDSF